MRQDELQMLEALGRDAAVVTNGQDYGPVLMLGILAGIVVILLIASHFLLPYMAKGIRFAAQFIVKYVVLAFKWVRGDEI